MRRYVKILIVTGAIAVGIASADAPRRVLAEQQTSPSGVDAALPTDVDPESRNRLAALATDSRDEAHGVAAIRSRRGRQRPVDVASGPPTDRVGHPDHRPRT